MFPPLYTAALTAFLISIQTILGGVVSTHRRQKRIGVGAAGDLHLERKIRMHANLVENAAIFVVAVALLESMVGQRPVVLALCLVFALGRIVHVFAFSSLGGSHGGDHPGRNVHVPARMFAALLTSITAIAVAILLVREVFA